MKILFIAILAVFINACGALDSANRTKIAESMQDLEKSCDLGSAVACAQLAELLYGTKEVSSYVEKAYSLAESDCLAGQKVACEWIECKAGKQASCKAVDELKDEKYYIK